MKKPELSIVIVSYNTKDFLRNCLESLGKVRNELNFEIIVPDNASSDGSAEMVEREFPSVKVIRSKKNLGFAAGNNLAKKVVKGKYVLFLNADTLVHKGTLVKTVKYLKGKPDVGALTCKMIMESGNFDKDARRSFITPWIGFTHIFLKLDRIFPKSKLFSRYWYGYIPEDKTHEVDVIQGAFFLTKKKVLDEVGWFDESFFLDGEDVDICWRIKKVEGYKIIYFSKAYITHFKGASKGKASSRQKKYVPIAQRLRFRMAGVNSMEIFYRRWLWSRYPLPLNYFVLSGIKLMKVIRFTRTVILG